MTQSERTLLGGVALYGKVPDLTAEVFSCHEGRKIWDAVTSCVEQGLTVNGANLIAADPTLNAVEIATLPEDAPGTGDLGFYVKAVRQEWRTREFVKIGRVLQTKADDPDDAAAWLEDELSRVGGLANDIRHLTLRGAMKEALDIAERRYHSKKELPGITTGLRHIDGLTLGMEPGELWLVGARPSVGKSAVLLNMALNAVAKKARVGYINLEDSASALGRRALACKSGVNAMQIATGNLVDGDFARMIASVGELAEAKFELAEGYAGAHISKVLQAGRAFRRAHKVDVLYVDYLQLIQGSGDRKHERIAQATEALKALAMQLDIPVCCAAQLTRDSEGREPTLADFAESSELEKAANVALLLHKLTDEPLTRELDIIAAKVRDGQTGHVKTVFSKQYLRIREEAGAHD